MNFQLGPNTTIEPRDPLTWLLRHRSADPIELPVEAILDGTGMPVGYSFFVSPNAELTMMAAGYPVAEFEADIHELGRRTGTELVVAR